MIKVIFQCSALSQDEPKAIPVDGVRRLLMNTCLCYGALCLMMLLAGVMWSVHSPPFPVVQPLFLRSAEWESWAGSYVVLLGILCSRSCCVTSGLPHETGVNCHSWVSITCHFSVSRCFDVESRASSPAVNNQLVNVISAPAPWLNLPLIPRRASMLLSLSKCCCFPPLRSFLPSQPAGFDMMLLLFQLKDSHKTRTYFVIIVIC